MQASPTMLAVLFAGYLLWVIICWPEIVTGCRIMGWRKSVGYVLGFALIGATMAQVAISR